jgi:23S rRNA (pseudouridine1915-N3)-methyltransferase
MRVWIAALGSRAGEAYESLARTYMQRSGALLAAKEAVSDRLFRSEAAFWEAVEREKARTPPLVVLLDEQGRQLASEAFAAWLGRQRDEGKQLVIFALGPADGWSEGSKKRAEMLLSLSAMTMAHELARVVICEQVYRALTILAGHPYHRGQHK